MGFLLTAKASVVDNLSDVTDPIRRDSGKTHGENSKEGGPCDQIGGQFQI
jgi:hypothetical protein